MLEAIAARIAEAAPGARVRLGRVAFLTNFIPPYRKPVLEAFARHCDQLKVFVSTPMEANRGWEIDWSGIEVQVQRTWTLKQRWKHPKAGGEPLYVHVPLDTFDELRRFRAEVVISVELGLRTGFAAGYRRLNPRSRLLVWADYAESTEKGRGYARSIFRRLLRPLVDAFVVNGASGARYLQTIGVSEERIFRVPYSTDVAHFGATVPGGPGKYLLYVGQLIGRKGLLPFVETLACWAGKHPEQRVEFVIAGDGPVRSRLETLAHTPNLHLKFLGNVPYAELPRIYAGAGAFVLPAFADTWGLVVNEAMACGVPVLGSIRAQAVDEMVVDGVNGWRFDPEDAASVTAAIERWMTSSDTEIGRMRVAARQTAMQLTPELGAALLADACSRFQA